MSGKWFFDTNLLVYTISDEVPRAETARALVAQGGLISVQILNEFASVARRKLKMSWPEIQLAVSSFLVFLPKPIAISLEAHKKALEIAERFGYGFYDSLVIASALEAGCETLYSEDMNHGQNIEGLRICNPFVVSSVERDQVTRNTL